MIEVCLGASNSYDRDANEAFGKKNVTNPRQLQQREAEGKKKRRVEDEDQRQKYRSIEQCHSWLKKGVQL